MACVGDWNLEEEGTNRSPRDFSKKEFVPRQAAARLKGRMEGPLRVRLSPRSTPDQPPVQALLPQTLPGAVANTS
jgi:hypothetical protein